MIVWHKKGKDTFEPMKARRKLSMIALQKVKMKWKMIFDKDEWFPWLINVKGNFIDFLSFVHNLFNSKLLFISKQIVGYIICI